MNVGILVNQQKKAARETLLRLCDALLGVGVGVFLEEECASWNERVESLAVGDFSREVDVAIVLGGDGTMLNAVGKLAPFEKPIAGLNLGTLGFLTSYGANELEEFARILVEQRFTTSARTLLDARIVGGAEERRFTALNEITVTRGEAARLVSLRALVNGELLNHYRADGLIVATPTGSTAYSLSAGGPLISPHAGVFVLTPICPHSLSDRSLVLSDGCEISLSLENEMEGGCVFTVDGRETVFLETGERVVVKKADWVLRLLDLEGHSFYRTLREKMRWNGG